MAYDVDGSTQYFKLSSAIVTAVPLTMACWFNPDNVTVVHGLVSVTDEASPGNGFFLIANGTAAGDPIRAAAAVGGAFSPASSSSGFTSGAWQHACGVFTTNSSRTAYLNGGSAGTSTTASTPDPATIDSVQVGTQIVSSSPTSFLNGRIAEPAIWNVALTAAEVASLAKGVSPAKIRHESLIFYPPLIRELVELIGGVSLTATGSPTVVAHPRVYGL